MACIPPAHYCLYKPCRHRLQNCCNPAAIETELLRGKYCYFANDFGFRTNLFQWLIIHYHPWYTCMRRIKQCSFFCIFEFQLQLPSTKKREKNWMHFINGNIVDDEHNSIMAYADESEINQPGFHIHWCSSQ